MRGIEQIPWLYDTGMRVMEWSGLARWRDWLARGVRGRVLEVGCGTGRNLPRYAPGTDLVAVDPSLEALAAAGRRAPGVPLVCASAEALPFRDGAFDTVVSSLVFCSVGDPARGLAEIRRVLAPSGELRMMEHVRARTRLGGRWQDFYQPAWTWALGGCHPNRDTESAVERAGFTIDRAHEHGYRASGNMRRFLARSRA